MNRSSCGLKENLTAGFMTFAGIFGLVFLYLEKESALVRFYIVQNFLLDLAALVVGSLTCGIGFVVALVFWIIELVNAFKGVKYKIPLLGDWADKILA